MDNQPTYTATSVITNVNTSSAESCVNTGQSIPSTTTKEEVVNHIIKATWLEEALRKYFPSKQIRDEFRQEFFLIILQMNEEKLIRYYDNKETRNELRGVCLGIISNQVRSCSSAWHRKFRKRQQQEVEYDVLAFCLEDEADKIFQQKNDKEVDYIFLETIEQVLEGYIKKDPYLRRDVAIFKMHTFDKLSYTKISDKTNISIASISKYVNNIKFLLRRDIIKNRNKILID